MVQITFNNLIRALRGALVLIPLMFNSAAYGLEIYTVQRKTCAGSGLILQGRIKPGDASRFSGALNEITSKYGRENCAQGTTFVWLNSEGGSVEEALHIGREVRANNLITQVRAGESCNSSCVFVYAAGVLKIPDGSIGIHRPYFSALSASASQAEVRQRREALSAAIKAFLIEVDVPIALLEDMLSVAPDEIRVLKRPELERLRLFGTDPTFDEFQTAQRAAMYGMTSAEYRRADAESMDRCPMDVNFGTCREAVILKIPLSEVQRRETKVRQVCPTREAGKFYQCYRDIMVLGK